MARKDTINFIRELYFQPEQNARLKDGANVMDFDRAIRHIQSDQFLNRFAERLEEEFTQEEIKTLREMYTSELSRRYSRSNFIFIELFIEIQKVLTPPLVCAENESRMVREKLD